ncbi:hypothetical protein [Sulfitobacter donghicola]|uniref:Uncharacterized protein n=1 Tax=Sulfitobacter donghicola DSW-25 = KCTC 12864 = JCM 14565 TaxID=1300350 RepID=A0A073ICJ6_9RHOB|nr:hypothetical protein [Sulfitobacter donghicola]KEJ88018.1 hypothetical protein DSW25_03930 [Sulfitobacter donghicola DSW-25 = KCTC 12864 = JCM 14565]KIN69484.1 hypothetical protein Z948_3229 [Sulfitobacter donghicola DSW-25 = KCTC 12864 = JCM 14565]
MPATTFLLLLLSVMAAAGLTVWLLSLAGPSVFAVAVPAALIATFALRKFDR